jgi:protein O-mannosyl-transferase
MAKVSKGKNIPVNTKPKALPAKPKRKIDWMIIAIIALCFALYSNTIPNKNSMDDELVTSTNVMVAKGFAGLPKIWTSLYSEGKLKYEYRPIVKTTYAIEHQFFGDNSHISHFINILLYALTCLILFKVLKRLMKDYNVLFLFFIVILFLAHPIHTEVVASLKNRDELLSFMFCMVALNYLITYATTQKWWSLILAFFFYILAYLSKSSALVFLAVFPLTLYFFTDISWKKLAVIFGVILVAMILSRFAPKTYLPKPDRAIFFFENPLFEYKSIFIRFSTGMVCLLFYLRILIYPHPLLFYYGYDMIPVSHLTDGLVILGIIVHLALFVFAIWKLKKKHVLSFAILYYLICVSMFSNILKPAMGIVAERFIFSASLGFCIVLAWFIFKLLKKDVKIQSLSFHDRKILYFPLVIILLLYSVKTIARNTSWKDRLTLYNNDIVYLDKSAKANALIAGQMMTEMQNSISRGKPPAQINQRIDSIFDYFNQSLKIYPDYYSSYNNMGSIYYTILGSSARNMKDTAKARECYNTAITYFQKALDINPDYPEALFNIACSYEMIGEYDKALINYRKNIALKSDNIRSLSNMANLYFNQFDNYDSAVAINERIMKIDTSSSIPYLNLGGYSIKRDSNIVAALGYFETAMDKSPENYELATKLSKYYNGKDAKKYLKYKQMAEDAKKKLEDKDN